jgi:hypothetical protein
MQQYESMYYQSFKLMQALPKKMSIDRGLPSKPHFHPCRALSNHWHLIDLILACLQFRDTIRASSQRRAR